MVGAAWDIVTVCGVPRFIYNDLPLGNPLGKPWDSPMQTRTMDRALSLLVDASAPVVVEMDHSWSPDDHWKERYMAVTDDNLEELRQRGEENRRQRSADKAAGLKRQ